MTRQPETDPNAWMERLGPAFFISVPLWATGAILTVAALAMPDADSAWLVPISISTIAIALVLTIWGLLFGMHRAR